MVTVPLITLRKKIIHDFPKSKKCLNMTENNKINIKQFLNTNTELTEHVTDIFNPIQFTYTECLEILNCNLEIDDTHIFKINTVIDYLHERLNTGHWSNVPICYRYAFTATSFIKAVFMLKNNNSEDNLRETLKYIDLGILLGAPLPENPELLVKCAKYLTEELNKNCSEKHVNTNKRKYSMDEDINEEFNKLNGQEIKCVSCPSIESFNKEFFVPQTPVKLTDCMNHWPAMQKWQDINYLLKIAGNRTVPIELGSNYTDENWGQKLMTLQDFIKNYFLNDETNKLGYLAQHNLFDQIPELRNDIFIPDYCCLSTNYDETTDPDINAWFGPKNTVSPLHYDPKNNFLTQVFGTKQIILFHPNDSKYLYSHEETLLDNTARVNPLNCDLEKYPMFKDATMFKCLLKPGEMLFIPVKWWHHVTALEKSFSVSFWWQ